jgi:hypothetical protein
MVLSIIATPVIAENNKINIYNQDGASSLLTKSWSFEEEHCYFNDNLNECLAYELQEDELMKYNKNLNNESLPTETTASFASAEAFAVSPSCNISSNDDFNNFDTDDWFMNDVSFINDLDIEIAAVFTHDINNINHSICVAQPCEPYQHNFPQINQNEIVESNYQSTFHKHEEKNSNLINQTKDEDIDIQKNIESITNQIKILNDSLHKHENSLKSSNIKDNGIGNCIIKKKKNIVKYHSFYEMSEKLKKNRLSSISKYLDKRDRRNWLKYKPDAANRRKAARNRQRNNGQFLKRKISWVTLDQYHNNT